MVLPTPKGSPVSNISSALYTYRTSRCCSTFSIDVDFVVVLPGTLTKVFQPSNHSQNSKKLPEFDWTILSECDTLCITRSLVSQKFSYFYSVSFFYSARVLSTSVRFMVFITNVLIFNVTDLNQTSIYWPHLNPLFIFPVSRILLSLNGLSSLSPFDSYFTLTYVKI